MPTLRLALLVGFTLSAIGCGDNSKACGDNTELDGNGFCVGTGSTVTCTNGTRLNEMTNECEIDPAACQNGTVLVDGACRDPNSGLMPTAIEGAEPNGFGLGGEPSAVPAGEVMLGSTTVILKGNITPHADRDDDGQPEGDFDTYLVDVTAPTLVEVTADGLGGLAAGFFVLTDVDGLESWMRIGVNLSGDTTKRQLFLPAAGTYALVVADTRTLTADTAVGDAGHIYYVTLKPLALMPEAIALTAGVGTKNDTIANGEVRLYTAAMGLGLNEISLVTDHPDFEGSLVVVAGAELHSIADETKSNPGGDVPATLTVGGIDTGDTALFVVDQVINTVVAPVGLELEVRTHGAVAMSTTGTAAMADAVIDQTNPSSFDDVLQFYFDATAAEQTFGMNLAWNQEVDGLVLDERGAIVSTFSFDLANAFDLFSGFGSFTWTDYVGLFRAPAPGRYYFVINAPTASPGDDVAVTSTITALTPASQTFDTTLTATANAFHSVPIDYPGNAEAWQLFTLADTGPSSATVYYYDGATAFGRLDNLTLDDGTGPAGAADEVDPLFFAAEGSPASRIMLGQTQRLFGKISTPPQGNAGTITAKVVRQTYTDELTVASGQVVHTNELIDSTTRPKRYLLRTAPRNTVQITVTPTGTPALLDPLIRILGPAEQTLQAANLSGPGAAESSSVLVGASGFIAVAVDRAGVTTGEYTITFNVVRPPYVTSAGATTWTNICPTGIDVTPADHDDGITGPLTIQPMDFFGANQNQIRISTNGWLTFDTTTLFSASQTLTDRVLPTAAGPNALIAAYWDDLTRMKICTKQSGTLFIVQWRGELYRANANAPEGVVAVQAILDSTNDSVELVYAPYMTASGISASSGVENASGLLGTTVFFHTNGVVPGASVKLTP